MAHEKGPTGRDDTQHEGKIQDARPNEGGRSGGQHAPQIGKHSDKARQDSPDRMKREKATKGRGSPA